MTYLLNLSNSPLGISPKNPRLGKRVHLEETSRRHGMRRAARKTDYSPELLKTDIFAHVCTSFWFAWTKIYDGQPKQIGKPLSSVTEAACLGPCNIGEACRRDQRGFLINCCCCFWCQASYDSPVIVVHGIVRPVCIWRLLILQINRR